MLIYSRTESEPQQIRVSQVSGPADVSTHRVDTLLSLPVKHNVMIILCTEEVKCFHTNFMFELCEKHYQSRHTDNNTAHSTVLSFWVLGLSLSALLIVGVSLNAPSGKVFKTIAAVLSQQHF